MSNRTFTQPLRSPTCIVRSLSRIIKDFQNFIRPVALLQTKLGRNSLQFVSQSSEGFSFWVYSVGFQVVECGFCCFGFLVCDCVEVCSFLSVCVVVVVVGGVVPGMVGAGVAVVERVNVLVPSCVGIFAVAAFVVLEGVL